MAPFLNIYLVSNIDGKPITRAPPPAEVAKVAVDYDDYHIAEHVEELMVTWKNPAKPSPKPRFERADIQEFTPPTPLPVLDISQDESEAKDNLQNSDSDSDTSVIFPFPPSRG